MRFLAANALAISCSTSASTVRSLPLLVDGAVPFVVIATSSFAGDGTLSVRGDRTLSFTGEGALPFVVGKILFFSGNVAPSRSPNADPLIVRTSLSDDRFETVGEN